MGVNKIRFAAEPALKSLRQFVLSVMLALLLPACQSESGPNRPTAIPLAPATDAAPAQPAASPSPGGVAAASQAVWLTNPVDQSLLVIDPAANRVAAQIPLGAEPLALAVGEGGVWLILRLDGQGSQLLRIDPLTYLPGAPIPVSQGEARTLAAGGGWLWLGIAGSRLPAAAGYRLPGSIVRINPANGLAVDYLSTQAVAAELVVDGQTLWALEQMAAFTYLDRIDTQTGEIHSLPEQVESLEFVHWFTHLAVNSAGIWATSANPSSKYIYHIDPTSGRITHPIAVGRSPEETPLDLTAANDAVWIALRRGWIMRLDSATMQPVAQVEIGGEISDLFLASGDLWVIRGAEALVTRIDGRTNQVVASIPIGSRLAPTPTPSLRPPPGMACADSYPSNLRVGIRAVVNPNPPIPTRLRAEPDLHAGILGQVDPGKSVEILEGPACSNGWVWWEVYDAEQDMTGWMAEGDGQDYWLIPFGQ